MRRVITILLLASVALLPSHPAQALLTSSAAALGTQDKKPPVLPHMPMMACGPLLFQLKSSEINDKNKCLTDISSVLQKLPTSYLLVIDAHRDSSEPGDITVARAERVRDHLVKGSNISLARVKIRDYGDTCPSKAGDKNLNGRLQFWYLPDREMVKSIPEQCASSAKPVSKVVE